MRTNCWELKACGRGPGAEHVCPAATAEEADGINRGIRGGRVCWAVAGTFCGGEVQGDLARKLSTCIDCDVYRTVRSEEGADFLHGARLVASLAGPDALERVFERAFVAHAELVRVTEAELTTSGSMKSIGEIAIGVAHEMNTPLQYVGDHLSFVRESVLHVVALMEMCQRREAAAARCEPTAALTARLHEAEARVNLPFILENLPDAVTVATEGLRRINTIVRSLNEFAHPGSTGPEPADLNRVVVTTLAVARSEYRHWADVSTDLEAIPVVNCHIDTIRQALLNIVINAAHAVRDAVKDQQTKGRITVRTWREDDAVCIAVSDSGVGIPPSLREKIFEPFFTTRQPGEGSGQGLALAKRSIVEHGGAILVDSEVGRGSTFTIRLPLTGERSEQPAA